ncbi:helix-turn-helix domain-containing protein [Pseudoclavibacter sp. CFCC 11306]|uniref:helix-turn-helix domain-containing protein n=1 Tax=Pseudoclavibacter sp. CFCC 11306 TaxID=1564493 RepID=UPI00130174DE|nr:PucR family transcriptional regulator [Pseudoclavibacter sp. CFCC 11306]KAB1659160.1 hypothetical protein F8O09_06330 [Pseudoclavibacter sp. CFCC 11306]
MTLCISDVISHFARQLQPIVGSAAPEWQQAMHCPVRWTTYTNLIDPAPYLRAGELVLTTGPIPGAADDDSSASGSAEDGIRRSATLQGTQAREYVRRLREVGAAGIVVGPVHPDGGDTSSGEHEQARRLFESQWHDLIDACAAQGMPLLWGRNTVFIEFARELGALIRADEHRTDAWLTGAQQRITDAALTDGGPAAVVEQLAEELGSWVVCFDDMARARYRSARADDLTGAQLEALQSAAARVLGSGLRGAMRLDVSDVQGELQTLGPSHGLVGVVAVGTVDWADADRRDAGRHLLSRARALLSLSLVRTQEVRRAESGLSAAVLRLLLSGAVEAAHHTAASFSPLPDSPVVVVAGCSNTMSVDQVASLLGRAHRGTRSLTTVHEGTVLLVVASHDLNVDGDTHEDLRLGVSQPVLYDSMSGGLDQAMDALRRALAGDQPTVRYEPAVLDDVLTAVQRVPGMEDLARSLLQPLIDVDRGRSDALLETLRVWLETGGQWEAASARLQVHRHTLRARIEKCARVLDVDLRDPKVRHELWLALQALSE